jgi:hypothetical protein
MSAVRLASMNRDEMSTSRNAIPSAEIVSTRPAEKRSQYEGTAEYGNNGYAVRPEGLSRARPT